MLNNLTNFFNLIVGRRIKTQLEDSDLIAVGTKQSPNLGDYKPTAIKFSDLASQLGGLSSNTWDMPDVAFVATDGNNSTAVVGDGNKPFLSIGSAIAAANFVVILPGSYSQSVIPTKQNLTVYCMPGVVFTTGGLSQTTSAVNIDGFRFIGYPSFEGTSAVNLRPGSMNNSIIEIGSFTARSSNGIYIFPITTKSAMSVHIKYANFPSNAQSAPNISFRDNIAGHATIDYVEGFYKVVDFTNNKQDFSVNVGTIVLKNNGNFGNAGGFKVGLAMQHNGSATNFNLDVNVEKIIHESTTLNNDPAIQITSMPADSKVNVKVGYIQTVGNPILLATGNNATSSINLQLNGKTPGRAFLSYGAGTVAIKNSVIVQGNTSLIQSSTTFIDNSSIYNTGIVDTIYSNNSTGILIMNNVGAQGDPAAYVYNGVLGSPYGFNNVISNQAVEGVNPVNLYAAAGLVVEPAYVAPKI